MRLFKKPSWLKPEVDEPIYYLHIAILAIVVLGILQYFQGGNMLSIKNVLWSIPLLTIGDIISHSILNLQ